MEGAQAGWAGAVKAKSTTRSACFGTWGFTGYKSRDFAGVTVRPLTWMKKQ